MTIHTKDSISGFIASEPRLTYNSAGVARFYSRFGQEHFNREEDGTYTRLAPTFGNLVLYRASAEKAYERFAKGDSFIAQGKVNRYSYERENGEQVRDEEFIASKIGHDTARTRYEVDRTPRQERTAEREAPNQTQQRSFEPPPSRTVALPVPSLGV